MGVQTTSGWGSFLENVTDIYTAGANKKIADANATIAKEATATKALEAQINAQNTAPTGLDKNTIYLLAGGGVLLVGAIVALR